MAFHTAQSVQLMTEVERRAYADRAKFLGDVDFFKVPVENAHQRCLCQRTDEGL